MSSLVAICGLLINPRPALAATTVQSLGDAAIRHDEGAGTWVVSAGGAAVTVVLDQSKDWQIIALQSPTGHNWIAGLVPDTRITANGSSYAFGSRAAGFAYSQASTTNDGVRLGLDATFSLTPAHLVITRHIAAVPGSPTFEFWTTVVSPEGVVSVSNLAAIDIVVTAGMTHWVTGHAENPSDTTGDSIFAQCQRSLNMGDTLTLGSRTRSSEKMVPWLTIDGADDELFAGLMWSGSWSMTLSRYASGVEMTWGLVPMATTVGAIAIDGPHVIVGATRGSTTDATAAMKRFIIGGLRRGRPFASLVTYNTWFAYGTAIDEPTILAAMDNAAKLGAELFVIDAGWYTGADTRNPSDFDQGLGTWTVDPARFPNGMAVLRDHAHSLGMKFGIWVEPERVNLAVVGTDGLDESMLATDGGSYDSPDSAQICLVGAAGRQWVLNHLTALLDAVQPDYLKWDNNLWVNCDRSGHGHGLTDGNFGHVTALYQILEALHQRYPSLMIENCSQGGNRLDFGMLRYTDIAWMDDRTAPSVHVRHNIEGLSAAFPPAYLLSFVTDHVGESIEGAQDLSLYFRSRMAGTLGLCFRTDALSDSDLAGIRAEIASYKTARTAQADAAGTLLSAQVNVSTSPPWDVLQETSSEGTVLLYAFDNGGGGANVLLKGLDASTTYVVQSVDVGPLGESRGSDLMINGISLSHSSTSAAHFLILTPKQ